MYLDLLDVLRVAGNATEKKIDLPPMTLEDIEFVEPIRGTVRVTNARQNIVVRGEATTAVAMQCARCLQTYTHPMELELEATAPISFFQAQLGTVDVEEDEEDVADDEMAAIFDAHSVDVLELIRQAVVIQWPPKPLCSPDCPGLPEMEKYTGPGEDDRWEALKNWKENEESNGSA